MEQYEHLKLQLFEELTTVSKETTIFSKQAAKSIHICIDSLEQLKILVNKDSFKSVKDEIYFFRQIKPEMSARLIYHIQLYNIESGKPSGTDKQIRKYFNGHLKTVNQFVDANISFYKYYRSESVYLDEKYFTRSKSNLHLILDDNSFNYDLTFNTSHDHKVAKILAFDQLTIYLNSEINKLERNLFSEIANNAISSESKLKWTDNKIALIELMYALHSAKCINSGKAELSEIAAVFEGVFDIELKDYYRKYIEIKGRKGQNTKFIDNLKQVLENRIDTELK